jgi:hypothetical protein
MKKQVRTVYLPYSAKAMRIIDTLQNKYKARAIIGETEAITFTGLTVRACRYLEKELTK